MDTPDPIIPIPAQLPAPAQSDLWLYRLVVGCLAVVAIATVIGLMVLSATGHELPQAAVALGSTALGALAGIISPIAK